MLCVFARSRLGMRLKLPSGTKTGLRRSAAHLRRTFLLAGSSIPGSYARSLDDNLSSLDITRSFKLHLNRHHREKHLLTKCALCPTISYGSAAFNNHKKEGITSRLVLNVRCAAKIFPDERICCIIKELVPVLVLVLVVQKMTVVHLKDRIHC